VAIEAGTADMARLGARLADLTGERYSIRSLRPASTGYANTTWLVDAEPRSLAIKVQTSPAYVYARDPALEPQVLAALASTSVPVPPLLAQDDEGSLFGSPWFAMALVDGIGLPDEQLTGYAEGGWFVDADPDCRSAIWNDFVDRLADLHSLPADTFGFAARGGSHSRMLDYWTESLYDVLRAGEAPVQARALAWLRDNAPGDADSDPRPCMGDARMANLLARDGRVVALVDWELAHVGNPRSDIAYHLYLDGRYATVAGRRLEGLPDAVSTWQRWEHHTGLAATDRRYWTIYGTASMAITATRAMRLGHGFEASDIEAVNPMVADIEAFLNETAP
jgi:aminoglycoside phosphotransferase (APT) family kinase protein